MLQLTLLLGAALGTALYFLYDRYIAVHIDPREPPFAPSKIPVIGHAINMMRFKSNYYVKLRFEEKAPPIYSLAMPGSRIYVVNTPELVKSVQRQHKIFAFPPVAAKGAMTVCASSKEANDILNLNVNGDEGDWGYSMDFYKSLHNPLSPGPGLDNMNRIMVQNIAASCEKLRSPHGEPVRIRLFQWLRHELTLATTNSVYGSKNPFRSIEIENAFWDFERDIVMIMLNILPSLTARNGVRGREAVAEAFEGYFLNKEYEHGSELVQSRYATSRKHKVPVPDIARYEVGGSLAVLVNTVPTAFWVVWYVFSHRQVLADIRGEVESIMTTSNDTDEQPTRTLDMTMVKTNCPILTSTFSEVLRLRSVGLQVRQVMQDYMLDDSYLLKKDGTIFMPNNVVHADGSIWGSDVESFNHKRFMKEPGPPSGERKRFNPAAFRAFGGGTTLCPGRHFATVEILAVLVMFVMRFDVSPVVGYWQTPTVENTNLVAAVMEPDTDIEVDLQPRKGFEQGEWAFSLKDSSVIFAVAAEDTGNE